MNSCQISGRVTNLTQQVPMSFIETTRNGHVLEIKVNRADKHNALSPEMYRDLARAYAEVSNDPELRVGLLYADGKHFTSGIELDKWAPIFSGGNGFSVGEGEIDPFGLKGPRHSKPVVMAMQGNCFTWGVEILLNTEVRVAADDTRFAMLEVKRGIFPCGGRLCACPNKWDGPMLSATCSRAMRGRLRKPIAWAWCRKWCPLASNWTRRARSQRRSPRRPPWGCKTF